MIVNIFFGIHSFNTFRRLINFKKRKKKRKKVTSVPFQKRGLLLLKLIMYSKDRTKFPEIKDFIIFFFEYPI